jgi:hypothetical protein
MPAQSATERNVSRRGAVLAAACAAAFLIASRVVFTPTYLSYFDNINFALAIEHFDPAAHQPQPPGYPLFVALLKILNPFLRDPRRDLQIAGLIGSGAALWLVWLWASRMFGRRAGWMAGGLLLVHPVFWIAGVANPVRTFLPVIAGAAAVLSWQSLAGSGAGWFYGLSAALGFLSGFRPECLLLLLPLWAGTGIYRRMNLRVWIAAAGILGGSALVWIGPLVWRMGGIEATYREFFQYLRANSVGYTAAFGAAPNAGLATVRRVVVWNFGMALGWIWAAPFVWRSLGAGWSRRHGLMLALSFAPAFVFHALVHVRDVDQTLITIPVVCVVGGAVLARLRPPGMPMAGLAVAVFFSFANFREPMFPEMSAACRGSIRFMNNWSRSTMAALNELQHDGDEAWVWDDSVVTWRQVTYYYPEQRLLDVRTNPPLWLTPGPPRPVAVRGDAVLVPDAKRLVLGISYEQSKILAALPGAELRGPLVVLRWRAGEEVHVGGHLLLNSPAE